MEKRMQSLSLSVMFVPMIRITIDPAVMSGKPCIRGLRVTVANVLRQLANHRTPAEILASYPYLEAEDIDACLAYDAVVDEELAVGAA
jgi:uncharacterized protein (DUF433 family)